MFCPPPSPYATCTRVTRRGSFHMLSIPFLLHPHRLSHRVGTGARRDGSLKQWRPPWISPTSMGLPIRRVLRSLPRHQCPAAALCHGAPTTTGSMDAASATRDGRLCYNRQWRLLQRSASSTSGVLVSATCGVGVC
jgi:hypothetical protein